MNPEQLISRTQRRFPRYERSAVEITALEKGGSDRKYYRMEMGDAFSLILVKYNPEKAENARFVSVARFLEGLGVNAPCIYHHEPADGLIWMQDLGERDLWHYRRDPWETRETLYQSALDQALTLHRTPIGAGAALALLPPFDEALYRWEQRYGFDNAFGRYFGVPADVLAELVEAPALKRLAADLARLPLQLVHRDFQSQNVLVWEGEAHLIDFQGMRPGLAAYDVASLLYDPYVEFTAPEREALLLYYHERSDGGLGREAWADRVRRCALQRLLQALGAYGTIGLLRGKPEFLRHVRPAMRNLREVASQVDGFSFLADFAAHLPDRPEHPQTEESP